MNADPVQNVVDRLQGVKPKPGGGFTARCPAHEDKRQSLSIDPGDDGKAILRCFAGCPNEQIVAAIGLKMSDLFPAKPKEEKQQRRVKGRVVAVYSYVDENAELLYQVERDNNKEFWPRRPDGRGGWINNMQGVRRVPYALPEVIEAIQAGRTVYVVEGEKDADNLRAAGLTATSNMGGVGGGAGQWKTFAPLFKGAKVAVLPDNDDAGRSHAHHSVAAALHPVAASVRVVELPGLPAKGDVSDWLKSGGTGPELEQIVAKTPLWEPSQAGGFVSFVSGSGEESPIFSSPPDTLTIDLLPVPSLTPDMLPEGLRGWIEDIAARGSFPLEYVAVPALIGLSTVVGRRIGIKPKKFDDWLIVPNQWGAIVGPPGALKTPAAQEALRPLARLEVEARAEYEAAIEEYQVEQAMAKARAEAARENLKKSARKPGNEEEMRRHAREASSGDNAGDPPVWKRYTVNDVTVEKLGELLRDNPDGLLLNRDELTGFFKTLERSGHEGDRAFYLEAWNGTGSFVYDRIGRGTVVIDSVCLSLFGTIQPGPLARYLRSGASGDDADGFPQRLQMMVYPDPPRKFVSVDRWPNSDAKNTAYAVFKRLSTLTPASVSAQTEEGNLPFLRFTPEAQTFFDEWRTGLENRLLAGFDVPLMQAHLSKYRKLMPALSLLFHLIDTGYGSVSLTSAKQAAAWCDFLEAHARRIYQSAMDGDPETAQRLAERIKQSLPNPFTYRQVVRKCWSGLTAAEDVEKAVGLLEDRGWVKTVEVPSGDKGGRPTVHVYIHPDLQQGEKNSTHTGETTDKTDKTPPESRNGAEKSHHAPDSELTKPTKPPVEVEEAAY